MLDCEEKKGKSTSKQTFTTFFVPRQLLVSSSSSSSSLKSSMAQQDKHNSKKPTLTLSSKDRVRLFQTICEFFELNGFHKTLKKFRKEADIEKDSWKNCSLNLEEMFQEHLRMCNNTDDDGKKPKATLENGTIDGDDVKPKKKKKSKSSDTSEQVNAENDPKTSEHEVVDTLSEPVEVVKKSKKKKKQKDELEPSPDNDSKEKPVEDTLSIASESGKKSKDKKKKHKDESEVLDKNAVDGTVEPSEAKKGKSKSSKVKEDSISKGEVDEAGKGLKKRKKSSSDDIANNDAEEMGADDPKRRKMDDSDKSNGALQSPDTPKQTANGFMEKDNGEDADQGRTKERNGSAEPTSVKAFQRVKAEEVKFVDDRLKDNSYWAKDGAESGYGAKAQEVLGQVRGRDFRHEKTKKKRGTYRGGQIDLQSHSIKFSYDDDE